MLASWSLASVVLQHPASSDVLLGSSGLELTWLLIFQSYIHVKPYTHNHFWSGMDNYTTYINKKERNTGRCWEAWEMLSATADMGSLPCYNANKSKGNPTQQQEEQDRLRTSSFRKNRVPVKDPRVELDPLPPNWCETKFWKGNDNKIKTRSFKNR